MWFSVCLHVYTVAQEIQLRCYQQRIQLIVMELSIREVDEWGPWSHSVHWKKHDNIMSTPSF